MFDKILIANRGEIACRVMETARALGVASVAVYSDADRAAKHVAVADEAVFIGGSAPSESYLRGDVIIAAAIETGAQAIHPGYGFLSENPEFVEAVEAAGLVFIGPSASAIRAMGLKDNAKTLMAAAGVPVVPGYMGDNQDETHLMAEAARIGYPVMIKAVAGGGGKGMRMVESAVGFDAALQAAKSEAMKGFGNDVMLIEKFIEQPRHIEVQVFGDGETAVHLFERDCSLQRRHQKVIEEAPAPDMPETVRNAMGAAAVKAAEAIGYKGAGTVEFIVDGAGGLRVDGFWFMEMNTRLQVEHPVTEAITGVDLVEWQLRVAAGEALPMRQDELSIDGHAFEARLYAEDVPAGFLPATGTLAHLEFPQGARSDSGVRAGDTISPFYDPMIAKVITHGPTRAVALAKMRRALRETQVGGTVTNLGFLGALAAHEGFGKGEVDTGLIARDIELLVAMPEPDIRVRAVAGLAAMGVLLARDWGTGFTLWASLARSITLAYNGEDFDVVVQSKSATAHVVSVGNDQVRVEKTGGVWFVDGARAPDVVVNGGVVTVFANYGIGFTIVDPLARGSGAQGDGNIIEAPMPGAVKAVFAKAGQVVQAGDRLAILEAMKMEHALLAARDGVVAEVLVSAGDQVEAGAALIRLEDEDAEVAA
ncbi:MAG: biotin carboxylase N-terminal domain-containing protein [Rhodobacterales bacterium]|nr:biotin carboxylase N-terminal domain-containing protein [Rhodobacterales bacterium]